jgi:hypothetical protein
MSGSTEIGDGLIRIDALLENSAQLQEMLTEWLPALRALNDGSLPEKDRLSLISARLRAIAEELDDAAALFLTDLAELLDPRSTEDAHLRFVRAKAGKPPPGGWIKGEERLIAFEARLLYRKLLEEGISRNGLKKKVSDEIGHRYGKMGSTVDKLWRVPKASEPLWWPE